MNSKYTEEKQRLQRAIASAEYRELTTEQDKLRCLLFTFSIKPYVVIKEMAISRDKVYYLIKKNGKVNPTAGRPRILNDTEVQAVKSELTRRAEMLKPATRRELVDIIRPK
jgi:hypothetical protein